MYLSLFSGWNINNLKKKNNSIFILNFGPQHPAAHGVLRLILQLEYEYIVKIDIHIGLLHRGTEFLIQSKSIELNTGYFDRLDYVSMLNQEHAFIMGIEKFFLSKRLSLRTLLNRIVFDELTRILNHLLAIACHALDIGSMSGLFWAFEERENIMEFYEYISGARMHANLYKPGENLFLFNDILLKIINFIPGCIKTISEISLILFNNKIWKTRLINIGVISINLIKKFSITGVIQRSTGIKSDLRCKINAYGGYKFIELNSYSSINGDCYDRFLLRTAEIIESLRIILKISKNHLTTQKHWRKKNYKNTRSMEQVIETFLLWNIKKHKNFLNIYNNTSENFFLISSYLESPKGEFGVLLNYATYSNKLIRCKIRSSSFHHLNLISILGLNMGIADLVTLIGTIDIVFGEIDK